MGSTHRLSHALTHYHLRRARSLCLLLSLSLDYASSRARATLAACIRFDYYFFSAVVVVVVIAKCINSEGESQLQKLNANIVSKS